MNKSTLINIFSWLGFAIVSIILMVSILLITDSIFDWTSKDPYANYRIKYPTTPNYRKIGTVKSKNGSISFYGIGIGNKGPIVIAQYDRPIDYDSNTGESSMVYNDSKEAQKQVEKFAKDNSLKILNDFIVSTNDSTEYGVIPKCFDKFYILGKKNNISHQKNKKLSFSNSMYKNSITYDKKHKRIKLKYNRNLDEKSHKYSFSSATLFRNMIFDVLERVYKNGFSIKSISVEDFVYGIDSYNYVDVSIDIE